MTMPKESPQSVSPSGRPRLAVYKFASCDGCQLALLNLGPDLLALAQRVDIVHFAEAGVVDEGAAADIALVEGSISTPEDVQRIHAIRRASRYLVSIGACATAGGLQALRDMADAQAWVAAVYARPEYIASLATSDPVTAHVPVDLELWGCPVSGRQVVGALTALLNGALPRAQDNTVCMECKRAQHVCVLVSQGQPCMGPVTRAGCGALCPGMGRDCYACYGPADNCSGDALAQRFAALGLTSAQSARRFLFINNGAPAFRATGQRLRGVSDDPGA